MQPANGLKHIRCNLRYGSILFTRCCKSGGAIYSNNQSGYLSCATCLQRLGVRPVTLVVRLPCAVMGFTPCYALGVIETKIREGENFRVPKTKYNL